MEIRLFDQDYNVVTINRHDIVSQKWVKNHFEYYTRSATYHGASNTKEEAALHTSVGFFKIDTNTIINMEFIDRIQKNGVFVNGVFYKVSRELLADLKRQLRK